MRTPLVAPLSLLLALAAAAEARDLQAITAPTTDFSKPEAYELNPGGAATSNKSINRDAFSHPSANLTFEQRADFFVGNGFFDRLWVSAPASTDSADGLGPLYNARACQRCHLKDGRGHPPAGPDDSAVSLLMRLSVPPRTESERQHLSENRLKFVPEPTFGGQLQDFGVLGHEDEGQVRIRYEERRVELAGGEIVSLRAPTYSIEELGYGPLASDVMISPRIAPPMIGLGLLEFISKDDILANADADDADGDGISGRPNWV
ncbi:MAG: thiol oxidoreductase, partial [Alphaproteobacteria bacterium]|nr:thiol oxidoreductase [Alphaproteobacteria bacterium]